MDLEGSGGASVPPEQGVALASASSEVAPSSAPKLVTLGLEWYAIPQGWLVASVDSEDILLRPSESGGFE